MIIAIQALVVCVAVYIITDVSTANIFPILIGVMYGYMKRHAETDKVSKKENICGLVLGILFSLFFVLGQIETVLKYDSRMAMVGSLIITFIGFYFLFQRILILLLMAMRNDYLVIADKEKRLEPIKVFGISLLILLLSWGISLWIAYPGDFSWDSSEVLQQALGHINMDIAYPLFMTLHLRLCWNAGYYIWGNANAGVALYLFIQILLTALVVSYVIYRMYTWKIKNVVCFVVLLFYAVVPYNVHYSHTLWKDIPFSVCSLLFMQLLWEYYVSGFPQKKLNQILKMVFFVLSGIGMALSRTNGLYAFIFFIPFGLLLFWKRNKKIFLSLLLIWGLIMLIQGPVYNKIIFDNNKKIAQSEYPPFDIRVAGKNTEFKPKKEIGKVATSTVSGYSQTGIYIMTIQQFGRVVADRSLEEAERIELDKFFDVERMKTEYDKHIVNDALALVRWGEFENGEYLRTWIKYAVKYPYSYFIAFRDQTIGYWYPDIQYGAVYDLVFSEVEGIYRDSSVPESVRNIRKAMDDAYLKVPVYGMIWSIGFIVWVTFTCIFVTICKRDIWHALLYMPLIGIWLTLMVATPVFAEFRYIYPFFICLPISLIIPFVSNKNKSSNQEQTVGE